MFINTLMKMIVYMYSCNAFYIEIRKLCFIETSIGILNSVGLT